MTDHEIELLAEAFRQPPPYGFTENEKKQWIESLKGSPFVELAERRANLNLEPKFQNLFSYEK